MSLVHHMFEAVAGAGLSVCYGTGGSKGKALPT